MSQVINYHDLYNLHFYQSKMSRRPHFSSVERIYDISCSVSAKAFDPDYIHSTMWTRSWGFSAFCICLSLWSPTPDKRHVLLDLIPTILSVTLKPRLVSTLFLSISSSSVNPHPILSVFFHNCMEWLYNNYFL